jgi:hypothetical protein
MRRGDLTKFQLGNGRIVASANVRGIDSIPESLRFDKFRAGQVLSSFIYRRLGSIVVVGVPWEARSIAWSLTNRRVTSVEG